MNRRVFLRRSGQCLAGIGLMPDLLPGPRRERSLAAPIEPGALRLVVSDPAFLDSRPCFSPEGDRVLFMRAPAGRDPERALHADSNPWSLWAVPLDGGRPSPVFSDRELAATRPDWCRATGRIAFTGIRRGRAGLWLVDGDGRNLVEVPVGSPPASRVYYPSWYPDGSSLAVTDYDRRQVVRVDLASGSIEPLTSPGNVWAGMSSVSPDAGAGHPVAFAGQRPSGRWDPGGNAIWLTRPGHSPRRLDREQGRMPAWSLDGRRLAFVSTRRRPAPSFLLHRRTVPARHGAILIQPMGRDLEPVGAPVTVSPFDHGALHPRWAPGGQRLACMVQALTSSHRGIAIIELSR